VQLLLDRGADATLATREFDNAVGPAPIHRAAESAHLEALKALIAGAPETVNHASDRRSTPLVAAIDSGSLDAVKAMIEAGADVNAEVQWRPGVDSSNRYTPLMAAVETGNPEMVRLLIAGGAAVDTGQWRRHSGNTAIHIAAKRGHLEIVKALLEGGANPDIPGEYSRTPLAVAVEQRNRAMFDCLLAGGADVNASHGGWTPLIVACHEGDMEFIRALIEAGAKTDQVAAHSYTRDSRPRTEYRTPFIAAAEVGQLHVMQFLVDEKIDLLRDIGPGREIDLALLSTTAESYLDAIPPLIEMGANIDAVDMEGNSPLMLAVYHGKLHSVWWLVDHGADVSLKNVDGKTALELARDERVAQFLRERTVGTQASNATPSPWLADYLLVKAVEDGKAAECRRYLSLGARRDALSPDQWPAIVLAAASGNAEIVQVLIDAGANVDATGPDEWNALMQASRGGHQDIVKRLLAARAEMQHQSPLRQTALDLAKVAGHAEIVQLLESAGAAKSDGRWLIDAVRRGQWERVERLLEEGVNVDGVDEAGRTALFYAIDGRNPPYFEGYTFEPDPSVVELLIDGGADVNHADKQGNTPLLVLLDDGDPGIRFRLIHLLLNAGATVDARNQRGETIESLAKKLPEEKSRKAIEAALHDR